MYAQRLDLKDDTEVGKGTCAVNIIPITNGTGYKGIIKATCMCMWTNKRDGETVTL